MPFETQSEGNEALRMRKSRNPRRCEFVFPDLVIRLLLLAGVGLSLFDAGSALAQGREQIDFDFRSESAFTLLGGTIVTPPDGTLDVGSATISVEATAPGVFVPGGRFVLDGLTVAGTVSKDVFGAAQIDGNYAVDQSSSLVGTLTSGTLTGGEFADGLAVDLDIVLGCTGAGCSSLGFPISDVGPALLSLSFLPVFNLGTPGAARIEASIPIEVDGVLGFLDLVGVETGRTFVVPEPGTTILIAAGLAIMANRRRRSADAGFASLSPNERASTLD